MAEGRFYLSVTGSGNEGRHAADFFGREDAVGPYAYAEGFRTDPLQGGGNASTAPADIVAVEAEGEGIVAVGVEAGREFFALVPLL